MSTINTILKQLKSNTNLILNDEQNNTLYKYASTVLLPYNTLNYKVGAFSTISLLSNPTLILIS